MKVYAISRIFNSPRSEGSQPEMAVVFIRFGRRTPQPMGASACLDWEDVVPVRDQMTANEVARLARICNFRCNRVVLTGFEPETQLDAELIDALHAVGFSVAVETRASRAKVYGGGAIDTAAGLVP